MLACPPMSHSHSHSHGTHYSVSPSDLDLLNLLASTAVPQQLANGHVASNRSKVAGRRPHMDPLIIETAAASGPHVTRHHYLHEFYPQPSDDVQPSPSKVVMKSRQAPRQVRLAAELAEAEANSTRSSPQSMHSPSSPVHNQARRRSTLKPSSPSSSAPSNANSNFSNTAVGDTIACQVRTRIPTPHGEIALHLYHSATDPGKDHLAFVVGEALRSRSLEAVKTGETEMDRRIRGANVPPLSIETEREGEGEGEATLMRIHSECFTGETVGSQRCDCGEQLDASLSLLFRNPRGGVILYLRQEGRGIGLLEKMKAYNLQDMGHDTVSANLALGHGADERRYDLAANILKDLGVGKVRLITNNPDKVGQLAREGVEVVERVPIVPRLWSAAIGGGEEEEERWRRRREGVGMIGADGTHARTSSATLQVWAG
ncbi:hypothetical protein BT69DRAFT_404728 [Atractiella rhizophila]|nr:hypothetical protein BT69DRAFT_404728 [Atractiella rhizophila]